MTPNSPLRIFISSSPADGDFVRRLAGDLREMLGDDAVLFDAGDAQAGEVWRAQIAQAIRASSILLVILSPDAINSRWVQDEIELARTSGKRIIPVLARPCEIPPSLASLQSVSFIGQPYGVSLADLLAAIAPDVSRGITLPAAPQPEGYGAPFEGSPGTAPVPRAPVAPADEEKQQPSYQSRYAPDAVPPEIPNLTAEALPPQHSPYAADAVPPPAPKAPQDTSRRDRGGATAARTLQFSAFSPNEIATGTWSTLLVYTYVAEALAQIQADAATFTELGSAPRQAHGQSARKVRQGVELTIEPHMDGVTFSPPSDTFIWRGDWRRSLFRLLADPKLNGWTQHGWVDIHGPSMTPIASIEFALSFHQTIPESALSDPRGMAVTANIFDTVFISYSHRDSEAMRQARSVYDDLGVTVLVDELLESGDNFDERLMQMIQAANVFHLLWSKHSATSDYVRKEWAAALASGKGGRFIRPWYWRKPLVSPPAELEARKISFRYERLKRRVHRPATWL